MSPFHSVFEELSELQSRLTLTVNRLWAIKSSRVKATREGHRENDFLLRRLVTREREEQGRYEQLLCKLSYLVSSRLDSALISLNSIEDVRLVMQIRKSIRYIRNAFVSEIPLACTLERLNRVLSASSTN